jgi:hypothetical protein
MDAQMGVLRTHATDNVQPQQYPGRLERRTKSTAHMCRGSAFLYQPYQPSGVLLQVKAYDGK